MAKKLGYQFSRKDYGSWDVWHKSYTSTQLRERRAQLAKVANSRLIRLGRAKSEITGTRLIEAHQFDIILDRLENLGRKRFSESKSAPGLSEFQIKLEITALENFLSMKSSVVTDYRAIERSRTVKFIERGLPKEIAKSKEFYEFLSSETYRNLEENHATSDTILEEIESYMEQGLSMSEILEGFQNYLSKSKTGLVEMRRSLDEIVLKQKKTGKTTRS